MNIKYSMLHVKSATQWSKICTGTWIDGSDDSAIVSFSSALILMHPFPGNLGCAGVSSPHSVGPSTTKGVGISMLAQVSLPRIKVLLWHCVGWRSLWWLRLLCRASWEVWMPFFSNGGGCGIDRRSQWPNRNSEYLSIPDLESYGSAAGGVWWIETRSTCTVKRPRDMLVPRHERKKGEEHLGKAEAGEIASDLVCGICYLNWGKEPSEEPGKWRKELCLESWHHGMGESLIPCIPTSSLWFFLHPWLFWWQNTWAARPDTGQADLSLQQSVPVVLKDLQLFS